MLTVNYISKTYITIPSFREMVIMVGWKISIHIRLTQRDFSSYTFPLHKYSDIFLFVLSLESML